MELTVSTLRNILNAALEQLEDYNESDVVSTKTNTRYVGTPFIGTKYGYIDLNDIEVEEPLDDEEYEYDDDSSFSLRSDLNLESRIRRLEKLLRK